MDKDRKSLIDQMMLGSILEEEINHHVSKMSPEQAEAVQRAARIDLKEKLLQISTEAGELFDLVDSTEGFGLNISFVRSLAKLADQANKIHRHVVTAIMLSGQGAELILDIVREDVKRAQERHG